MDNLEKLMNLVRSNAPISSIIQLYNYLTKSSIPLPDENFSLLIETECREYLMKNQQNLTPSSLVQLISFSSKRSKNKKQSPIDKERKDIILNKEFIEEVFKRYDMNTRKKVIRGGLDDESINDIQVIQKKTSTCEQQKSRILKHFMNDECIMTKEIIKKTIENIDNDIELNEFSSLQSKSAYLFSLKVFLQLLTTKEVNDITFLKDGKYDILIERVNNLIDLISKKIHEKQMEHTFTDKEKENHLDWDKVCSAVDAYYEKNKNTKDIKIIQNMILSRLLTIENGGVPRRLDYQELCIKPHDDNLGNIIHMESKTVILNNYKTAKTYGKYSFKISRETFILIKKYFELTGETQLFDISNFSKYTTKVLRIITGKEINQNLLRKLLVNHYNNNGLLKFESDIVALSKMMGNSPASIRKFYQKRDF